MDNEKGITPDVPAICAHDLTRLRVAALVALAEHGIPADVQELLVYGDGRGTVASGALDKMITALVKASGEPGEVVPPANGERNPELAAIKRTIDYFVERRPVIGKHHAVNTAHITTVVANLDAIGEREAADTIVWLVWHRALDRERERFLTEDAHLLKEQQP